MLVKTDVLHEKLLLEQSITGANLLCKVTTGIISVWVVPSRLMT